MEAQPMDYMAQLKVSARNMAGWLKFLGIVNIISGAFTALSLVGIIIAWLPIWLGVVLMQAASKATNANFSDDPKELVEMMDKLRLYFIIQGVLIIVGIGAVIIGAIVIGAMFPMIMDSVDSYSF
jgi:uncharacterized protein (DUF2062 family)